MTGAKPDASAHSRFCLSVDLLKLPLEGGYPGWAKILQLKAELVG
jgi:hypothetical protein